MTLTLYPYQAEGVEWMRSRLRGLLADQPGLGKTIQVLMAIDGRYGAVIVCPAFLKENWQDESEVWRNDRAGYWHDKLGEHRPDLTRVVLYGRDSFRWPKPGEVVIVNYRVLPTSSSQIDAWLKEIKEEAPKLDLRYDRGSLIDDPKPGSIASLFADAIRVEKRASLDRRIEQRAHAMQRRREIGPPPRGVELYADEAQACTNAKSETTKTMRELVKRVIRAEGRVFPLTGTPMMDRQKQLWCLLVTFQLHKMAFGDEDPRGEFERMFDARQEDIPGRRIPGRPPRTRQVWGKNILLDEAVPALRRVMLRRLKRLVLEDLPDKTYQRLRVSIELSKCREVQGLIERFAELGIDLESVTAEALDQGRRKIGFAEMSAAKCSLAMAKVPFAIELAQTYVDAGVPIAVASDHKAPVDAVAAHFGWPKIHGGVPTDGRSEIVKRFQDPNGPAGIALSIGAAGVGLTLHRAWTVLRIDRNWTPAKNEQLEDRFHRIGQKNAVQVIDLIADHALDRRMSEVELAKTALMAVVDAAAEGVE